LIDLPTSGRPCDTRRAHVGLARPSDLIQKAVRYSSPRAEDPNPVPQFSNGLRLFQVAVATQSVASQHERFRVRLDVSSEGVKWPITLSPLSRVARTAQHQKMPVNSAGQAILRLLHKAADAAETNSRQALETAQKLSSQLRAAEDRIAELEAEVSAVS
jgi:hypothetical protein